MHPTADTTPVIFGRGVGRRVMPGVGRLQLVLTMNSLITATSILVVMLLSVPFVGCRRSQPSGQGGNNGHVPEDIDKSKIPTPDSPYLKIYVSKSGAVLLDGTPTAMGGVRDALAALSRKNGVVLYYRESPEEPEPHPVAKDVINLVIQNRLPIRVCRNSDFSDAVLPNGKLRLEE